MENPIDPISFTVDDIVNAGKGLLYSHEIGTKTTGRSSIRAFDVVNLQISNISATEVSLQWDKPGGIAVGYQYAYDVGTTPPTDCEIVTTVADLGDTSSGLIAGLTSGTTYSFSTLFL